MESDPLWVQVEIAMSFWCLLQERSSLVDYSCECPGQKLLKESTPEALTSILTALQDGTYTGCWKKYLEA